MQEIIPHSLDNTSLLDYFDAIGIECNVEIISIAFADEHMDRYIQRPVHMSMQGEYQYIISYISQLRDGLDLLKWLT